MFSIPQIKIKTNTLRQRIARIKNYGKANLQHLKQGLHFLEPLRLIISNHFDVEYRVEKKKNTMIKAGINSNINTLDIIVLKFLMFFFITLGGFVYFYISYMKYSNVFTFFINNLISYIGFSLFVIIVLFGDNLIFSLFRRYRINSVLNRLVFFINLFKNNIMSGDNLYRALQDCATVIPGVLGKELENTLINIPIKGKIQALKDLSVRLEIDELTDFINLIITGINTPAKTLADFLDENESRLHDIKLSKNVEKHKSKPVMGSIYNTLTFLAIVSLLITIFVLLFMEYIDKLI